MFFPFIDPSEEEENRDLDPGDMRHRGSCDRQRAMETGALRMVPWITNVEPDTFGKGLTAGPRGLAGKTEAFPRQHCPGVLWGWEILEGVSHSSWAVA